MLNTFLTLLTWCIPCSFSLNDFRVALQFALDNGNGVCNTEVGIIKYSNWAREDNRWSPWATTARGEYPDCIRLRLQGRTVSGISNTHILQDFDFRICIQASAYQSGCGRKYD